MRAVLLGMAGEQRAARRGRSRADPARVAAELVSARLTAAAEAGADLGRCFCLIRGLSSGLCRGTVLYLRHSPGSVNAGCRGWRAAHEEVSGEVLAHFP